SPTTPPPLPKRAVLPTGGQSGPTAGAHPPAIPQGNRATAAWATEGLTGPSGAAQSGPFVGKLSAAPDEPAFAGRVRMSPGDESTFETGRVRAVDDRDEVMPANRGSRAGMWVLVMALLVMGAGAAAVYVFVIRGGKQPVAQPMVKDAGVVAVVAPDAAAVVVAPTSDAAPEAVSPLDAARGELAADVEPRLRTALLSLDGKPDAPAQALRAQLIAQLAQDLQDRASVTADKPLADTLRKEARQLVLDAATAAQRALKTAGDDAGANIAMASVLRLQGKPARDIKRYLDMARAKPDKDWTRDLALADGLVLARDNKLDDAKAAFSAIDQGDGKLESSGDVRARLHLALVLAAQNKAADAKPLVEAILAAQPEHAAAKALAGKLETLVAQSDPLPPEDGKPAVPHPAPRDAGVARPIAPRDAAPAVEPSGGDPSYERLLKRANTLAESSCTQAMELYAKALEQKPNGMEALTGMGYCHIDAKQFASAFSKFRAALAVSSRYEPALRGVAEAYQQQGRKEQAIEAYKAYLEIYPESAAAKKQLERLGGGDAPAPPPPAPTPPAPTPPAEPAGAGSGSE
ncbi:MAG: tetratricopeptide repeat protein, partial [Kofleriaceae bacterium]